MTVSRDATSGFYCPASSAEWTELLAGSGIPNPTSLHLLQEASGTLADSIGARPLDTISGSGTALYQQAVTGWSRKSFNLGGSFGKTARCATTDTVQDFTEFAYAIVASNGIADNAFFGPAGNISMGARQTTGTTEINGHLATGSVNLADGAVHRFFQSYKHSTTTTIGQWESESITDASTLASLVNPTLNKSATGSITDAFLYHAVWVGTALTSVQITTVSNLLVNGPPVPLDDGMLSNPWRTHPWIAPVRRFFYDDQVSRLHDLRRSSLLHAPDGYGRGETRAHQGMGLLRDRDYYVRQPSHIFVDDHPMLAPRFMRQPPPMIRMHAPYSDERVAFVAPTFDAQVSSPTQGLVFTDPGHQIYTNPINVTLTISANTAETNGHVHVEVSDSYGGLLIQGVVTTGLSGWSEDGWINISGTWVNDYHLASVPSGGGGAITFNVDASGNTGITTIASNIGAPTTDQATGTGNSITVHSYAS